MVYDSVNNPAAGGADTDTGAYSYRGANSYANSSRANSDADTWGNSYANSDGDANGDANSVVEFVRQDCIYVSEGPGRPR